MKLFSAFGDLVARRRRASVAAALRPRAETWKVGGRDQRSDMQSLGLQVIVQQLFDCLLLRLLSIVGRCFYPS